MGRKQAQVILAALICWPVAAQDYNPVLIPPQFIGSPQTMTPINGGDDSTSVVQFAFPFEYFGQTFTSAWVSTNGFISFQSNNHLCCNGMPIEQAPRNAIYASWSDLISGGNPYYRSSSDAAVFGWYNTYEYGTNLRNTFEIALFPDGKIQWNYGDMNNQYHIVSAGLTGPTMADSISLFYGQNINVLDNTSYISGAPAVQPEPEPPMQIAPTGAPEIIDSPIEAVETVQDTVEEEVTTNVVIDEPEEASEEVVEIAEDVQTVTEEIAVVEEAVVTEDEDATDVTDEERLSPDEVAALAAESSGLSDDSGGPSASEITNATEAVSEAAQSADEARQAGQGPNASGGSVIALNGSDSRSDKNVDFFQREAIEDADTFSRETVLQASLQNVAFLAQADAQYVEQFGQQKTTETNGETYSIQPTEGPTFAAAPVTGMGDMTTPVGQAQQMELLNMGMQNEMSAGTPADVGDMNSEDNAVMTQLAAVPEGYGAYTQARIPDMPFYQPKDIYKGRRIPDANLALYRMMRGQDQAWDDMVEDQYE